MAHILEDTKSSDKTYGVWEVIENEITALMVRMDDYKMRSAPEEQEIIESWRHDLVRIRVAIYNIAIRKQ